MSAERWWEDAACRGLSPALFYPPKGDMRESQQAQAICSTCPVALPCLDEAVQTPERWGIWGGATSEQRKAIRRDQKRWDVPEVAGLCG